MSILLSRGSQEVSFMIMIMLNTRTASFYYVFFVFTLLCCKYICDIYLSIMDSNGLSKLNNIFIYKITEEIQ